MMTITFGFRSAAVAAVMQFKPIARAMQMIVSFLSRVEFERHMSGLQEQKRCGK
jgi:hypothetical protein